ncbi:MAG: 3-methyl-2-oxobutanoate hydroxymethyltransferase [Verrucomicrobia bacterium]|nr:3-methyl-2-oxobutanoate hydroxymethyltransferase [Verrucomicrobiota bacterium]
MASWTANKIKASKGQSKLACLTAYDFATARLLDRAGIPLILVGDSLAMTMLGYETTLPVTMAEMLHHTKAVARGVRQGLVVADMPFMSYQVSIDEGLSNAGQFIKDGGAGAVKIEGGAFRDPLIRALVQNGIPVLGHIGLTPQSIREKGGYRVEGQTTPDRDRLCADAVALATAGVFALVLECVPAEAGQAVTAAVPVPVIGIGAGPHCDGQILVTHDVLGYESGVSPKFVKAYANVGAAMSAAFAAYRDEVERGVFPDDQHSY